MLRQNLVLGVQTSPQQFVPSSGVQINTPSTFTSGTAFEKLQGFKSLAAVGAVGVAGKKVFDSFTSGFGQRTGRTDLQSQINRSKKTRGTFLTIGGSFAFGGVTLGGAVLFKTAVDGLVENFEERQQRILDRDEADFKQQVRGNIRNRSRSGQ